ncbi:hypothetical protein HDU98_000606 [Podochytrium sp. JEL0797]|nr:hypothetical protein HDU98_000606 [Podochytrium sp. JEL0797]
MIRPIALVLLSLHINLLQLPSLLLLPLSHLHTTLTRSHTPSNPFHRAFVLYNWFTQRLFVSVLILTHWSPSHPLELWIYDSEPYTSDPVMGGSANFDRCVVMSNHQTLLDWVYLWLATWHRGKQGSLRIMLKDSIQWVPVFGWGMYFFSFVYMSRNWAKDERDLLHRLPMIRDNCLGYYWLLLFPEGTIISPSTLEKARGFIAAAQKPIPALAQSKKLVDGEPISNVVDNVASAAKAPMDGYTPTRVLIPRYKALFTCLQQFTSAPPKRRMQSLLDVTMAYEPNCDVTQHVYPEKVYSPKNVYLPNHAAGRAPPTRVHIGIEVVKEKEWIASVKGGDEKRFDAWLQKRWRGKEEVLQRFQETGRLREEGVKVDVVQIVPKVVDVVGLVGVVAVVRHSRVKLQPESVPRKMIALPELKAMILSWIEPKQAVRLSSVSKDFHDILTSQSFALVNLKRFIPKEHTDNSRTQVRIGSNSWDLVLFHAPLAYQQAYARFYLCHMTSINSKKSIKASIPVPLCRFPLLVVLELNDCGLTGVIPSEIQHLESLEQLDLSSNLLDGEIPNNISKLGHLKELNLGENNLSGCIPAELTQLSQLTKISLPDNKNLCGALPAEWGSLHHLEFLNLSNTGLYGPIPPEWGQLANLKGLRLSFMPALNCSIPPELGSLTSLENLQMTGCNLVGTIPRELGRIAGLKFLYLDRNALVGEVPEEFLGLENLEFCMLKGNAGLKCLVEFVRPGLLVQV